MRLNEPRKSLGLTMRQSMYERLKAISDLLDRPMEFMLRESAVPMMAYYSKIYADKGSLAVKESYEDVAMELLADHFSDKQLNPRQITLNLDEEQFNKLQTIAEKTQWTLEEATQFILNEYFAIIFEQKEEQ